MYAFWKFAVKPSLRFKVMMPVSADVKSVHMQGEKAQMWALVDLDDAEMVEREFGVLPTGVEFTFNEDEDVEFIGTFLPDQNLVFHLVEFVRWEEDEATDCESCGEPFTEKDIDGGRCLSCGAMIT